MLTQRPELFRAAVVQVPLLDMLRFDKLLAGASWVDEYGSPQVPEERAWLEKMSPYQNLKFRNDYPEVFILTSTKDDRVHPGHARKYAAKTGIAAYAVPVLREYRRRPFGCRRSAGGGRGVWRWSSCTSLSG